MLVELRLIDGNHNQHMARRELALLADATDEAAVRAAVRECVDSLFLPVDDMQAKARDERDALSEQADELARQLMARIAYDDERVAVLAGENEALKAEIAAKVNYIKALESKLRDAMSQATPAADPGE